MGLLSGLLVTAPRAGLGDLLSKALPSAIAPALSGAFRTNIGGAINSGGVAYTPPPGKKPIPGTEAPPPEATPDTPAGPNVVDQITAVAPSVAPSVPSSVIPGALSSLANLSAPAPSVAPVTVNAAAPQPSTPALANIAPAALADTVNQVAGLDVTAPRGSAVGPLTPADPQGHEIVTPENLALLGAGMVPLATLLAQGGADGLQGAGEDPAKNGTTDWLADHWKELLGGGAVLGGLMGGGGGGNSGAATDALKGVADKATQQIDTLSNVANAGMNGNIGGSGMNSISRMVRQAQASIRQRYAAMGMSGSSAEADDLNAAAQKGVDQQFEIGQKMAQTGLMAIAGLTGTSATIYASLLNAATAKDTSLGNALANFAAAVAK